MSAPSTFNATCMIKDIFNTSMIRDGYIVSLHSCYFKQENILIGASEGGNWKTKSPYLQMCKWRAK